MQLFILQQYNLKNLQMNWHTFTERATQLQDSILWKGQQHVEHMATATNFILATERKAGIGHKNYADHFVSQIYLMTWTHEYWLISYYNFLLLQLLIFDTVHNRLARQLLDH